MSDARADELIGRFGAAVGSFLTLSGKEQHASDMFDILRRTLLGTYTFFDHLPWAIDLLAQRTTPEELGARGRDLCGTPTGYQIHAFLWAYLIGRENELGLGREGGRREDLVRVVDWWERMALAYRDGTLVASEDDDRQRVVGDRLVGEVLAEHGRPATEDGDYGKVTAALQLYNFMLHGEQRGTTFFHGPYEGAPGTTVLVEEFSRLRHNELPWSPDPTPLAFDTVCAVIEVRDVALRFDLFQGMVADPADYRARATRVALLTCDGPEPRALTTAEREELIAACASEQRRSFREMLGWDADYKIAYGAYMYANFIAPVLAAVGYGDDVLDEMRGRFEATAQSRLPEIAAVDPVPAFARMFGAGGPVFTPIAP